MNTIQILSRIWNEVNGWEHTNSRGFWYFRDSRALSCSFRLKSLGYSTIDSSEYSQIWNWTVDVRRSGSRASKSKGKVLGSTLSASGIWRVEETDEWMKQSSLIIHNIQTTNANHEAFPTHDLCPFWTPLRYRICHHRATTTSGQAVAREYTNGTTTLWPCWTFLHSAIHCAIHCAIHGAFHHGSTIPSKTIIIIRVQWGFLHGKPTSTHKETYDNWRHYRRCSSYLLFWFCFFLHKNWPPNIVVPLFVHGFGNDRGWLMIDDWWWLVAISNNNL